MLLKLSKTFLALLIFYTSFFQEVFFQIPNMPLILGFFIVLFLVILMFKKSTPVSNGISVETLLWASFAASSLFVGYLIAVDQGFLIVSVFKFVENLLMIIAICFICKYDGNIDYIVKVFILLALLCAITTAFWGVGYQGGSQISLTATTNPNGLGVLLVSAMFCLLYKLDINKKLSIAFVSAATFLFLYTIILTGSRKSFLAASLLLIYWLVFCFRGVTKKITRTRRAGAIILLILVATCFLYFIAPFFQDSVMLQRLTLFLNQGDQIRTGMYSEAYKFFLSSPLFGIGYNNYMLLSVWGTYSHSTYAEALACTGMLGVVLYFSAYVTMAVKTTWAIFNKRLDHDLRIQARSIFGMFLVMLFLGTGIIHFYEINSSIVFAMIIGFNKLHYVPKRKKVLRWAK